MLSGNHDWGKSHRKHPTSQRRDHETALTEVLMKQIGTEKTGVRFARLYLGQRNDRLFALLGGKKSRRRTKRKGKYFKIILPSLLGIQAKYA